MTDKKAVLILGAGLMQRPAIEASKSLGFIVAVVDGNPNALCVPDADLFEPIDLKDKDALLNFGKQLDNKYGLAGVFTAGTDFSASVSYVSENMGLKSHSYEAALNASDKIRMRRCFSKHNVPSPKFIEISKELISNNNEIEKKLIEAEIISYPLVIKPVDNMGARGCSLIQSKESLITAINESIKYSRSGRCILEEYMDGPEFSIDALVFNGEVTITGFADRHIFYPPYFIEMGHTMPTNISINDWNSLVKTFVAGIKALELTHGAAKADIKLTSKGPMIGEIAARLSGGYMSGWTFPYSSDCYLIKQGLLLSVGKNPEELLLKREKTAIDNVWNVPSVRTCAERAWISIPGVVKNVVYPNKESFNSIDSNVKDIFPRSNIGDTVVFPVNNVEKCGNVITVANKREDAVIVAEKTIKNIIIELEPHNKETEKFLQQSLETTFPPSAFQLPTKVINELFMEFENENISSENISERKYTVKELVSIIPDVLKPYIVLVKDWNYRSMQDTFINLEKIIPDKKFTKREFYTYLIRGGIQGVLYFADTQS